MKNFKIKSYCKINLSLKVIGKLKSGYHKISTLITFCDLHDIIYISKIKSSKDKISFSGQFKKGINNSFNTVTLLLNLLRKNNLIKKQSFKINIKKNIPHGSGLGGGSSNAASLLNYFCNHEKFKITKNKKINLAKKIGFDVPISLERKNTFLTGNQNEILRFNKKFKLNLLIVYPNIFCSTKKIYKANKKISLMKTHSFFNKQNNKKLISFLKNNSNDLEQVVVKMYPRIKKIIDIIKSQKGCLLSRITGSGSACVGIFSNKRKAIYAQKMIRTKYPKYWCVVSKTI